VDAEVADALLEVFDEGAADAAALVVGANDEGMQLPDVAGVALLPADPPEQLAAADEGADDVGRVEQLAHVITRELESGPALGHAREQQGGGLLEQLSSSGVEVDDHAREDSG
jgi:hypothetical protein